MNNYINGIKINVDKPYPIIKGKVVLNEKVLKLIEQGFGGKISETTAINQYIFQHLITKNKAIKNALKTIAIVEMKHYEILGELLDSSGNTPIIGSINFKDNFETWNSSFVYYNKDLKNYLLNNIIMENNAIQNYKEIINNTNDPLIKELIQRIILDEYRHLEIFHSILNTLS